MEREIGATLPTGHRPHLGALEFRPTRPASSPTKRRLETPHSDSDVDVLRSFLMVLCGHNAKSAG